MTDLNSFKVDLYSLSMALSEALGLVGGKIVNHGKRVALLSLNIAEHLDLSKSDKDVLFTAALLHDAGVSRMSLHEKLKILDWPGAQDHCDRGAELLTAYPHPSDISGIVKRHHTKWTQLESADVPERTALMANLVFLADRIDVLIDWDQDLILNRDRIKKSINDLNGVFFNPDAVKVFNKICQMEAFWLSLYPRHLNRALERFKPERSLYINLNDLENAATIFARIVDGKTPFTVDHSEGVAKLCRFLAQKAGLDELTSKKLKIAGLFHDLGKLAVPEKILEKPAPLTPVEFEIIKRHPFETHYLLSGLPELADISEWAAFHHEKMDGSGYPFHLTGEHFSLPHIIVMVSDMVQALIQDRPHRPRLARTQVLDILEHMTSQNVVFEPVIGIMKDHYESIEELALNNL